MSGKHPVTDNTRKEKLINTWPALYLFDCRYNAMSVQTLDAGVFDASSLLPF